MMSVAATAPRTIPSHSSWESIGINKLTALRISSYLNDPACKVREYFYTFYTLDAICSTTIEKVVQFVLLALGIVVFTVLAPFTTPFGLLLRGAVGNFESKPFVYIKGAEEGKKLPVDNKIKVVAHNGCFMVGGYSITSGQMTPPSDRARMNADLDLVTSDDPDVVCLYEVPDVCDADYISAYLKNYPFVIPVAGTRTIGPNSMMYVASKYEIDEDSIEFTPFIKGVELTGPAAHSEKGVLQFGLKNPGEEGTFATVFTTHLQHSEIPGHREDYEIRSRDAQMNRVVGLMQKIKKTNVILVGDLNEPEEELENFCQKHQVDWLRRDPNVIGKPTWGGEVWCALLMGREPSPNEDVLDYAFGAGKVVKVETEILDVGYSAKEFRKTALSDHKVLSNTFTLGLA